MAIMDRLRPTRWLTIAVLLAVSMQIGSLALAQSSPSIGEKVDVAFAPLGSLLERFVVATDLSDGGRIAAFDYDAALASGDLRSLLDEQDRRLAAFDPAELTTREAAVAFWINAYNYFIIAHVLREARATGELVESVKDFGSFFRPFALFGRELFKVGGRRYSLDQIEKETLLGEDFSRRGWFDARVHFAVNCASVGCPPLRSEPYRPERLDAQLDDNTRQSLATPLHLRIEGRTVYRSSLFDWYADDFRADSPSIRAFITEHLPPERAAAVRDAERTRTIDYDWRLNEPSNFEALRP